LVDMAERDLVDLEEEWHGRGCSFPPHPSRGSGAFYFVTERTHLMQDKFSLLIDNYSGTTKPKILSKNQLKTTIQLHNNEILILS